MDSLGGCRPINLDGWRLQRDKRGIFVIRTSSCVWRLGEPPAGSDAEASLVTQRVLIGTASVGRYRCWWIQLLRGCRSGLVSRS